jgi:Ca-activated chloride channel family protein
VERKNPLSTWITAIGAVVLVAGYILISRPQPSTPVTSCANPVQLVVTASNEKSGPLGEMASDFVRSGPAVDDRCIDIKVVRKASGEAEEALARGWDETRDGTRPDVWSPAATTWVNLLREHRVGADRSDLIPTSLPSLMQSPLVIAMPRPMAEAMGWPATPLGWHDILELAQDERGWARYGHPEWGRFRLGKTDPTVSTSGLHALVGTYYAATGLSADLTVEDVRKPEIVAFVKGIEASVEHYGSTASTFLANLKQAADSGNGLGYVSAIAVEEKQILDYDQARPAVPLVAIYPREGTLIADHPYVVLRAPWVDDAKRRAAALFLGYLQHPDRQARFQELGFRDHEGRAGAVLGSDPGFLPQGAAGNVIRPPSSEALAAVQASWKDVRKRARVLMVLDVSGSMNGAKLDLMKRASIESLDLYADDDDVGVWTFSSRYQEIAPIAPLGPQKTLLRARLGGLSAGGATALYTTTLAAVRALSRVADSRRINAVMLLTDGQNSDANSDLEALVRSLEPETRENGVRVFTIGYGGDFDKKVLQRIAEATRAASYDASDPSSIGRIFKEVVSNF